MLKKREDGLVVHHEAACLEQSSRVVDGLPCMITRRLPGLVLVA
jgi:hypothetical protein